MIGVFLRDVVAVHAHRIRLPVEIKEEAVVADRDIALAVGAFAARFEVAQSHIVQMRLIGPQEPLQCGCAGLGHSDVEAQHSCSLPLHRLRDHVIHQLHHLWYFAKLLDLGAVQVAGGVVEACCFRV